MASGAKSKFGDPIFEPEVFRKQMYCIKNIKKVGYVQHCWDFPGELYPPLTPRDGPGDSTGSGPSSPSDESTVGKGAHKYNIFLSIIALAYNSSSDESVKYHLPTLQCSWKQNICCHSYFTCTQLPTTWLIDGDFISWKIFSQAVWKICV